MHSLQADKNETITLQILYGLYQHQGNIEALCNCAEPLETYQFTWNLNFYFDKDRIKILTGT